MVETATAGGTSGTPPTPARDAALLERALFEVKRVIVGQDRMVERMLVSLLAKGQAGTVGQYRFIASGVFDRRPRCCCARLACAALKAWPEADAAATP